MVLLRLHALLTTLRDQAPTSLAERLAWVEEELAARFPRIWHDTAGGGGERDGSASR